MLTEESRGKDAVEELQNHNLHLPSTGQVYILPTPTAQSTSETPTAKVIPSTLHVLQNFRMLVAYVRTFATTSKTLAAHIAWQTDGLGAGSDLEHLDLSNFTSSTSSSSLQMLEKLVLGGGGGGGGGGGAQSPPLFVLIFLFYFILFYSILIYLFFLFIFPLILS